MEKAWWKINVIVADAESFVDQAMEFGCAGAELEADSVILYLSAEEKDLPAVLAAFSERGAELVSYEAFQDQNWVQQCEDVWQPVRVGSFLITPVLDVKKLIPTVSTNEIFVVPGRGFGTGHHPSTRKCLEYLQHPLITSLSPKTALDIGSGSGILSIACVKAFGAKVDSYEIEESAVLNARENIALNNCQSAISLFHEPFTSAQSKYDLILANLYMEVLIPFEPGLAAALNPGGFVLIAGITSDTSQALESCYRDAGWQIREHEMVGEWNSYVLSR